MTFDEVVDRVTCPSCSGKFDIWVPAEGDEVCPLCRAALPPSVVHVRDNAIEKVRFSEFTGHEPIQRSAPARWFNYSSRRLAGSSNDDRLEVFCYGARWTIAVGDGAGGVSGGARAAADATRSAGEFGEIGRSAAEWSDFLVGADRSIERDTKAGETTLVVLQVSDGFVEGASVGDSEAWIVTANEFIDLTNAQCRKPLLGSGLAQPAAIARRQFSGRLLVATDGLFKYLSPAMVCDLARRSPLEASVDALVEAVRLPSGRLQDDIAIVLGEWVVNEP